jgi:hypothetical protein
LFSNRLCQNKLCMILMVKLETNSFDINLVLQIHFLVDEFLV